MGAVTPPSAGGRDGFSYAMRLTNEQETALRGKLSTLETEHRDLDDVIARLIEKFPYDQLQLQRLKKRKLALKDQMERIRSVLTPDIIA